MGVGGTSSGANRTPASLWSVPPALARKPVALLGVAVLYAVVGKLGQMTTTMPSQISPIFPSAGIAVAALLLLGRPAWFGVWTGSLVLNSVLSPHARASIWETLTSMPLGCLIAAGAASGAWAGAALVRRLCKHQHPLASGRNVLTLLAVAGIGCCAISPTVGVSSLALWGYLPWKMFGYAWLTWWLGDTAGNDVCGNTLDDTHTYFYLKPFTLRLTPR